MTTSLIRQVCLLWQGCDGATARVISQGSPVDAIESWAEVDKLTSPKRQLETALVLDDDTYVPLPFTELAKILPDRTGVLVIFKPGSYTHPDGADVFLYPNNAAIFNADGSLRFQVQLMDPRVHHIDSMHGGNLPEKFRGKLGVLVCFSVNDPPEWAYVVDPDRPEVLSAGQWVRW